MSKGERWLRVVLLLLTLAALFGMFSGSNDPVFGIFRGTVLEPYLHALHSGNAIVFSLSVGYLVSMFFWLLVVHFPERNRRRILRDNLSQRYQYFKEDTIQILLWSAIGSHDSELPKELCDYRRFKQFFKENRNERWYAALNGLKDNKDRFNDLLLELELFAGEVSYVLNNVSIQNPKAHLFFKRLNEHIYRLKNASVYSYDPVKYLGNFLWEILARWSLIDGQREEDVVQDMIDTL